jgi:HK97 family phage prohead protease
MSMEKSFHGGKVSETKQIEREGVPVGIVKGYIATWDVDRGGWTGIKDQFMPGAFLESIARHKKDNRPIRLKDHHGKTIGGFPINTVKEDSIGLYGEGEINLEVQQGREAFALAKQGVLSDFSIGWGDAEATMVNGIRQITKSEVWEGSIVDEPMNPKANITQVKGIAEFQDLPLGDRKHKWESGAFERVKTFTNSKDCPSEDYKKAFLWCDSEKSDDFDSYKFLIADVVAGKLVAIPRGIFSAGAALSNVKGGGYKSAVEHVIRYYEKMGLESPFSEKGFRLDDFNSVDVRTLEALLNNGVSFSNKGAVALAGMINTSDLRDEDLGQRDADDLKAIDSQLDTMASP